MNNKVIYTFALLILFSTAAPTELPPSPQTIKQLKKIAFAPTQWEAHTNTLNPVGSDERAHLGEILDTPSDVTPERAQALISLTNLLDTLLSQQRNSPKNRKLLHKIHKAYAQAFSEYLDKLEDLKEADRDRLRTLFGLLYHYEEPGKKTPLRTSLITLITNFLMLRGLTVGSEKERRFELFNLMRCQHTAMRKALGDKPFAQNIRPAVDEFMTRFAQMSALPFEDVSFIPVFIRDTGRLLWGIVKWVCIKPLILMLDLPLHTLSAIPRSYVMGYQFIMGRLGIEAKALDKPVELYYKIFRWPLRLLTASVITLALTALISYMRSNRVRTIVHNAFPSAYDLGKRSVVYPFTHGMSRVVTHPMTEAPEMAMEAVANYQVARQRSIFETVISAAREWGGKAAASSAGQWLRSTAVGTYVRKKGPKAFRETKRLARRGRDLYDTHIGSRIGLSTKGLPPLFVPTHAQPGPMEQYKTWHDPHNPLARKGHENEWGWENLRDYRDVTGMASGVDPLAALDGGRRQTNNEEGQE